MGKRDEWGFDLGTAAVVLVAEEEEEEEDDEDDDELAEGAVAAAVEAMTAFGDEEATEDREEAC